MLFLALFMLGLASGPASAQLPHHKTVAGGWNATETAQSLGALTPEERAELLARLSDVQVRDLLVAYLAGRSSAAAASMGPEDMLNQLSSTSKLIRENLEKILGEVENLPSILPFAMDRLLGDRPAMGLLWIFLGLAGLHLLGSAVEALFRRRMARHSAQLCAIAPVDLSEKIATLLSLTGLRLIGLAIFAASAAAGFFAIYQGHEPVRLLFMTYLLSVFVVRLAAVGSRFLFAPDEPELRLAHLDDTAAQMLHRRLVTVFAIGAFGFLGSSFLHLLGLGADVHLLLRSLVGLLLCIATAVSIWQLRQSIGELLLKPDSFDRPPGQLRQFIARIWHLPVIAYVAGIYLVAVARALAEQPVGPANALISLSLLIAVPIADAALGALISAITKPRQPVPLPPEAAAATSLEAAQPPESSPEAAQPLETLSEAAQPPETPLEVVQPLATAPEAITTPEPAPAPVPAPAAAPAPDTTLGAQFRNRDFAVILRRTSRIVLALVVVLLLASLWGVDLMSMSQSGLGAIVTRVALDIGFTLLVAYVAWELVRIGIDRQLANAPGAAATGERGSEGSGAGSRLLTLLPLFRRFFQIAIAVLAAMIILSALGVDIGPLLAGAGVVGLAVGFGAQTLVRDIVSGVFFLLDDAFRLGEYVDVGLAKGSVEAINVRSLVLRHHRGPLHTIPFGEIKYLTNFSRDWVIMKLEFRVPYETDMQKVKKIFKQIGAELLEHPLYGQNFLEPVKSQGVISMEDSAMIVRAKFMAKPGTQWPLRREVYLRVQQAFHEAGIEFARRRVAVEFPPDHKMDEEEAEKLAEAAGAAIASEEQTPQGQKKSSAL